MVFTEWISENSFIQLLQTVVVFLDSIPLDRVRFACRYLNSYIKLKLMELAITIYQEFELMNRRIFHELELWVSQSSSFVPFESSFALKSGLEVTEF